MKKIAVLLTAILIAFSLFSCGKKEPTNTPANSSQTAVTEGFKAPDSYAAVLKIKINPEFNLYIDKDGKALALEAVNSDAQTIMDEITYEGQSFESAIKSIITAANRGGFAKTQANVSFEITKVYDRLTDTKDILPKASAAANAAADELKINLTVSITQQSGDDAQSKSSEDNSNPTNSNTTSQKPTSSEPSNLRG